MPRVLIITELALICAGLVIALLGRFNVAVGRLPGDIVYRGRNTTFYFPWVTCVLLSVIGSLILWLFSRR